MTDLTAIGKILLSLECPLQADTGQLRVLKYHDTCSTRTLNLRASPLPVLAPLKRICVKLSSTMTSIDSNSAQAPLEDYNGVSPRVNGTLLPQFLGFFVILPCQLIRVCVSTFSSHDLLNKWLVRMIVLRLRLWLLMMSWLPWACLRLTAWYLHTLLSEVALSH